MKRIIACLCVIALLVGFVSCSKGGNEDTESSSGSSDNSTSENITPSEPELLLAKDGMTDYVIIYPENADYFTMNLVKKLITAFSDYTGTEIKYKDDFLGRNDSAGEFEILLGNVDRPESREMYEKFRGSEYYSVSVSGSKLLLGGGSDSSLQKAVDHFIDVIIKKDSGLTKGTEKGTLVMKASQSYNYEGVYYIKSIDVNGVSVDKFRIVYPADGTLECYLARLLQRHIDINSGIKLNITDDSEQAAEYEILIGNTNRSVKSAEASKASIEVLDKNIEIHWDSDFGMAKAYSLISEEMLSSLVPNIVLKTGDSWTGREVIPDNIQKTSDYRIMYHNVWGYINADGSNPISIRPNVALAIYKQYQPDVLCLQECSAVYRNGGKALFDWLNENYTEVVYKSEGGIGNPIFFRKDLFEVLDQGYVKSRNGDKGTTYVVLRVKSTGEIFGVTNSHFAANTNAGDDPTLGNEYRVQDAECMVNAVKEIVNRYGNITVFSGGDFNSAVGSDPINAITREGLKNIRYVAQTVTEYSPYYSIFNYYEDYDVYLLQGRLTTPAEYAIDHVYYYGALPEVSKYDVVNTSLTNVASDHAAHFIDFKPAKLSEPFHVGDPETDTFKTVDFDDFFA